MNQISDSESALAPESTAAKAARDKIIKGRNRAVALSLAALVALFFMITVVKFQH